MPPEALVSPAARAPSDDASFKSRLAQAVALTLIAGLYLLLPLLPLLASLAFRRARYLTHYRQTLKKMLIHVNAISEGPVQHYFRDVAGRQTEVPQDIRGECTQCGNCCLDKRCVFLERNSDEKYLCGIYDSPLRRYSNCGSFPLSAHDIERYACPGYEVVREQPIQWLRSPVAMQRTELAD